jgi:hypothetical protein
MLSKLLFVGAGLMIGAGAGVALAQEGECRAGCPPCIAWYARPGENCHYTGYYVGGGCAVGGSHRWCSEGTWGWDYKGCCLPRRVLLYWSHGHRYQGGTGSYKTDGPPVPDLPGLLNPDLLRAKVHKEKE